MRQTVSITDKLAFGPGMFPVIAGPCAVEGRVMVLEIARAVAAGGAGMLRGGAFKPRTSPRSFQGLGAEGLEYLAAAAREVGLPVVSEVIDPRDVELVSRHVDMLQVGSRNMQNFPLLREVGRTRMPVLLKRGASATIDELLGAADYILEEGNDRVVLCERGVRGFDGSTRYILDLAAVPILQDRTTLPVIVDPSHATGRARLVPPLARAALAAGADGLIVEVHPRPAEALSDGPQALLPAEFTELMTSLRVLAQAHERAAALSNPAGADSLAGARIS